MKIGIITYHFSDNYGAVLQAYALRKWFLDRGHEVSFINYHPKYVEEGGDFKPLWKHSNIPNNTKILYLKLSSLKRRLFGNKKQLNRFDQFRKESLGVKSKPFRNRDDIHDMALNFDLLVTGSDQIWNPSSQKGLDPIYFLSFAKGYPVRKISYAASFGKDTLPSKFELEAGELLQNLDAIAVREKSGIDIVNKVAKTQAFCVPDPTLLHTDYDQLITLSNNDQSGHIFCYALRTAEGIREVAEAAGIHFHTEIISPYNIHRRWREIGSTVFPGPADWLKQIKTARFVVTNSFHGTVFAVIFKRPFVVVGLPGTKGELNARAKNLLNQLGLIERFVESNEVDKAISLINIDIDWNSVKQRQIELINIGNGYLESQIAMVST